MSETAKVLRIARIAELAGVGAFVTGIILSVHHYSIGAFFLAGVASFAIGWKLRQP